MRDEAWPLDREHEPVRHLIRPRRERVRALQAVERAVDLDRPELARRVCEFLLLPQPLGIEHAAPGRVGPAGQADPYHPGAGCHAGSGTFSQPDSASIARPTWNTVASSNGRPASCTASGNPSDPRPIGTLMEGWPVTLKGMVWIGEAEAMPSTGVSKRGAVRRVVAVSSMS